jgi:peptide/nickel transport system permease protein
VRAGAPAAGAARGRRRGWRRFARQRLNLVGAAIVALAALVVLAAPWLAPHDPFAVNLRATLGPPSWPHPFGTDMLGRDVLSRIVLGTQVSVSVGLVGVATGLLLGVPLGLVAGYAGGAVDTAAMRLVDVLLAFPRILLALLVVAVLGGGLRNATIAIGLFSVPVFARVMRAATLRVRELEFVQAARALGAPDRAIVWRHVLPNAVTAVLALASTQVGHAILTVAALSFLGLGAKPPSPEWGAMLAEGRSFLRQAPHLPLFPGLAITVVVLGFNVFGEGLRGALDPKDAR